MMFKVLYANIIKDEGIAIDPCFLYSIIHLLVRFETSPSPSVGAPLLSHISLMNKGVLRKLRKLHIPNLMDVLTLLIYDNQKLIIFPNYNHVTYPVECFSCSLSSRHIPMGGLFMGTILSFIRIV